MNITALGAHCFVFIVMGMQGRKMPLLLFNVVDAAGVVVVAVVVIITTVICIVAEMLMK